MQTIFSSNYAENTGRSTQNLTTNLKYPTFTYKFILLILRKGVIIQYILTTIKIVLE